MDINQLLRESYKNTATAFVEEQFRGHEPDYYKLHVKALEKIAENMLNRVDVAERELALHKEQITMYEKQLAMYAKEIADAEKEASGAARRSRISIFISIVAIIASIAGVVLGAAINAGWIQLMP